MKKLIVLLVMISSIMSCETKQTVIDTGVCNPYFEGTVMDYMKANDTYWNLTLQMIERADIADLFEGLVDSCREITFFAPPSDAILRFLLDSQKAKKEGVSDVEYKTVADIPEEQCKKYILSHVIKGKYVKSSIAYKNKDHFISEEQGGGTDFTTLAGNRLRVYLQVSSWIVSDVGAVSMGLYSLTSGVEIPVATPDIQPTNGVIHALHTGYDFGNI